MFLRHERFMDVCIEADLPMIIREEEGILKFAGKFWNLSQSDRPFQITGDMTEFKIKLDNLDKWWYSYNIPTRRGIIWLSLEDYLQSLLSE